MCFVLRTEGSFFPPRCSETSSPARIPTPITCLRCRLPLVGLRWCSLPFPWQRLLPPLPACHRASCPSGSRPCSLRKLPGSIFSFQLGTEAPSPSACLRRLRWRVVMVLDTAGLSGPFLVKEFLLLLRMGLWPVWSKVSSRRLSMVCSTSRELHLFSEGKIHTVTSVLFVCHGVPYHFSHHSFTWHAIIEKLPRSLPFKGSRFLQYRCRNKSVVPLELTGLLQCLRVLYQVQQYQKTVVKCVS